MFRASWTTVGASSHLFEWTAAAHEGDVFPLHGAVARLVGCSNMTIHGQRILGRDQLNPPRSDATFEVCPPAFASAAPAQDHVFVPLQGEVSLDHDWRATAIFEPPVKTDTAPSVTIFIGGVLDWAELYTTLHQGQSFPWGPHKATIVRVVAPRAPVIGWAEVALSD
jgi:hypothetical protein